MKINGSDVICEHAVVDTTHNGIKSARLVLTKMSPDLRNDLIMGQLARGRRYNVTEITSPGPYVVVTVQGDTATLQSG